MPLYDYRCVACSHRFEVIHGVHGEGPATCPACGAGPVVKAVTAPAVHFKGSGWAKVDRRVSARSKGAATASSGSGGSEDGTQGADKGAGAGQGAEPAKDASASTKRENTAAASSEPAATTGPTSSPGGD